jgi:RimJ/RimL family protein N-acetyltransferase
MQISLRKVKKKDWDYILKLRNTKEFRKNFYAQHTISKKEHYAYLKKQQVNPNFSNWIICYNGIDVGYVRILDNDISIIVEKKYHGKGIGGKAIELVEDEAKSLGRKKLVGRVMIHNKKSQKIFLKNKYKLKMYWYEKEI